MDYQAFGMILDGLCQCGAWGCFDEFNRIDISVLSVISTQLGTIRNALLEKNETFKVRKYYYSQNYNYLILNYTRILFLVQR